MKGTIIAVVVVAVLAVGGFFVYRSMSTKNYNQQSTTSLATPASKQEPATTKDNISETSGENTVTYTNSGFSPKSITIKVGESVTFVNNSSSLLHVASNPHPIHTDLLGFDSKNTFSAGESYTYTFEKTGEHGYHNHLNPTSTGVVVIE